MDVERYTAWRIGCDDRLLTTVGTHVVTAALDRDPRMLVPYAAKYRDVVCLTRRGAASLLRTHPDPTEDVQRLLRRVPTASPLEADDLPGLSECPVYRYSSEPWFFVDADSFTPVVGEGVRLLQAGDAPAMAELHEAIDPKQRWYVELDHAGVWGRFEGPRLVAVAGHFVFEQFGVAAAGVLTHPEHRRRGLGTSVVSAAVQWALDRKLMVEWCTNERNLGSLGIVRRLGFRRDCVDTEFRIGADRPLP
jgi:RimJ/RimL family protein N-acetyltransferase